MDANFTRLDLLMGASASAGISTIAATDDQTVTELTHILRRALLDSPDKLCFKVQVERGRSVKLMWIAAGLTAGVAYWMDEEQVQAVSLLFSGLDLVEDLAAMQIVLCALPSALPQRVVDAMLQTSRPVIVSLYNRADLMGDLAIASGSCALAAAFFGSLGIDSDSESGAI